MTYIDGGKEWATPKFCKPRERGKINYDRIRGNGKEGETYMNKLALQREEELKNCSLQVVVCIERNDVLESLKLLIRW